MFRPATLKVCICAKCCCQIFLATALFAADPAVNDAQAKIKAGKYDDAIQVLDTAYKKNPKSAELKKALADAHYANAEFYMYNKDMPPFKKYPTALREYRKVLEFDKESQKAKSNIATIEGIYKQMGRPVPQ